MAPSSSKYNWKIDDDHTFGFKFVTTGGHGVSSVNYHRYLLNLQLLYAVKMHKTSSYNVELVTNNYATESK